MIIYFKNFLILKIIQNAKLISFFKAKIWILYHKILQIIFYISESLIILFINCLWGHWSIFNGFISKHLFYKLYTC